MILSRLNFSLNVVERSYLKYDIEFIFIKPTINCGLFFHCLLYDLNARVNKSQKKKTKEKNIEFFRITDENEVFLATFILYYR